MAGGSSREVSFPRVDFENNCVRDGCSVRLKSSPAAAEATVSPARENQSVALSAANLMDETVRDRTSTADLGELLKMVSTRPLLHAWDFCLACPPRQHELLLESSHPLLHAWGFCLTCPPRQHGLLLESSDVDVGAPIGQVSSLKSVCHYVDALASLGLSSVPKFVAGDGCDCVRRPTVARGSSRCEGPTLIVLYTVPEHRVTVSRLFRLKAPEACEFPNVTRVRGSI
jgi:hypothetical protein